MEVTRYIDEDDTESMDGAGQSIHLPELEGELNLACHEMLPSPTQSINIRRSTGYTETSERNTNTPRQIISNRIEESTQSISRFTTRPGTAERDSRQPGNTFKPKLVRCGDLCNEHLIPTEPSNNFRPISPVPTTGKKTYTYTIHEIIKHNLILTSI